MSNTGSPNCTCESGYEFTNGTCSDFDECLNNVDNCPDGISDCINTDGDYFCECVDGYNSNNATKSCEDIDECASNQDNDCNPADNRMCMNTAGNYTCICFPDTAEINGACAAATTLYLEERFDFIMGLSVEEYPDTIESEANQDQLSNELLDFLNGTSIFGDETLVDVFVTNYTVKGMYAIVEFRIDTTNSNLNSSYIDSVFTESLPSNRVFGSFHRIAEDDVDECMQFDNICRNGNCTNTDGSFYCTCNEGFQGSGTDSCTDIDECLGDHGCQQICNNEEGGYSCACSDGYELDGGGFNCTVASTTMMTMATDASTTMTMMTMSVDESTSMTTMATDASTTVMMMATDASTSVMTMATDTSPTNTAMAPNASNTMTTMATDATTSNSQTTDTDDCIGNPCMNGGTCTDGVNSFTCECAGGFTGNTCQTDINECNDSSLCANGRCVNNNGSYSCLCDFGFVLNEAEDTCTAIANTGISISRLTTRLTGTRLNGVALVFTNDLLDRTSPRFGEYQDIYCIVFINFLRGRLSDLLSVNCFVASFSSGSVIGTMELELGGSSQSTADGLAQNVTNLYGAGDITMMGNGNLLETTAISPGDEARGGLSVGAIIGIALGVLGFVLILITCVCCIFMQNVRREQATKLMLTDQSYFEVGRRNGGFYGGDTWSDDSLDERQYAVGRALDRFQRHDRSYLGSFDGKRRIPRREDDNFRTPYVADGSETANTVERNPIHY